MKIDHTVGNINFKLDTSRMDMNFQRAQTRLDSKVLSDSNAYAPFLQGGLRSSGHILEPGIIEWNVPYAHYQYEGELYLTEDGRSWASQYEKKYPSGMQLKYHHPGTGDHWFERAKQTHLQEWIKVIKNEVKKG